MKALTPKILPELLASFYKMGLYRDNKCIIRQMALGSIYKVSRFKREGRNNSVWKSRMLLGRKSDWNGTSFFTVSTGYSFSMYHLIQIATLSCCFFASRNFPVDRPKLGYQSHDCLLLQILSSLLGLYHADFNFHCGHYFWLFLFILK